MRASAKVAFRCAGVGGGADLKSRPETRRDWAHWLDVSDCAGVQHLCLAVQDALPRALNRLPPLGCSRQRGI